MSKEFDEFINHVDKLGNQDMPKLVYDVREDDVEKLATDWLDLFYYKQVMNPYSTGSSSYTGYEKGFIDGYNKSKETLYTEKDMQKLLHWADSDKRLIQGERFVDFIQSLKK